MISPEHGKNSGAIVAEFCSRVLTSLKKLGAYRSPDEKSRSLAHLCERDRGLLVCFSHLMSTLNTFNNINIISRHIAIESCA